MDILVGYTGFVGSNLYKEGSFDLVFNSKNIKEAYGLQPELLVYAGLRAEKYLANQAPHKDMELIEEAKQNISSINPKQLVLISTIDVYKNPLEVDEESNIITDGLHPYGYHRYQLEVWVREQYPKALIIRLPGLYGTHIKKNFIYDYINVIPFMLSGKKFEELSQKHSGLKKYYTLKENGFYQCNEMEEEEKGSLRKLFQNIGFCALDFTDSRSIFQFYPLSRLWKDIHTALEAGIVLWVPATEPIQAGELYEYLEGKSWVNEVAKVPVVYNCKTRYDVLFGGDKGYILNKENVMQDIQKFINFQN